MPLFVGISPPPGLCTTSAHPTGIDSSFEKLNVSPNSAPTTSTHRMYCSTDPPDASMRRVSSAYNGSCTTRDGSSTPPRSPMKSCLASRINTVMTMTNKNGDIEHP